MDTAVNWHLLSDALTFYEGAGYAHIEVPWFVPMPIQMLTCPDERYVMQVNGYGALVGSAEQAFLHLAIQKKLHPRQQYVALTPCFRAEAEDETHRPTFMKVELFSFGYDEETTMNVAESMVTLARRFMRRHYSPGADVVKTPDGWDLEINGIEVGSYGAREAAGIRWAYGTGLAEPRFSHATQV